MSFGGGEAEGAENPFDEDGSRQQLSGISFHEEDVVADATNVR